MMRIIGPIHGIETIAEGASIRELGGLPSRYGNGNWKKKKGFGLVGLEDGSSAEAELHWYEAHGIGKVKLKVKRWL